MATVDAQFESELVKQQLLLKQKMSLALQKSANDISSYLARYAKKFPEDYSKRITFINKMNIKRQVMANLKSLQRDITTLTEKGVSDAWKLSNLKNDIITKQFLTDISIPAGLAQSFFGGNMAALENYIKNGSKIAESVKLYTGVYQDQIDLYMASGIAQGRGAKEIARDLTKIAENPMAEWKKAKKAEPKLPMPKPGRGVYRSVKKNFERISRTETNRAFRLSEYSRRQSLPFVVGIQVRLSGSHPTLDICDSLAGNYPANFIFSGWHPHCLCFTTSILASKDEFKKWRDSGMNLEKIKSHNSIKAIPKGAETYLYKYASKWSNMDWFKANFKEGTVFKSPEEIAELAVKKIKPPKPKEWGSYEKSEDLFNQPNSIQDGKYGLKDTTAGLMPGSYSSPFKPILDGTWTSESVIKEAQHGKAVLTEMFESQALKECETICSVADFNISKEMQFCFGMNMDGVTAMEAQVAKKGFLQLPGVNYYANNLQAGLMKASLPESKGGAIFNVKVPKGKKLVTINSGGQPKSMAMPGSKYKVIGKETVEIIKDGKKFYVNQYNLEMIDDGSAFIKELLKTKQEIAKGLAESEKILAAEKAAAEKAAKAAAKKAAVEAKKAAEAARLAEIEAKGGMNAFKVNANKTIENIGEDGLKIGSQKTIRTIENPNTTPHARVSIEYKLGISKKLPDGRVIDDIYSYGGKVEGVYDKSKKTFTITIINVDETLRGQGLAQRLVEELINKIKPGYDVTTTGVFSPAGRNLFEKLAAKGILQKQGDNYVVKKLVLPKDRVAAGFRNKANGEKYIKFKKEYKELFEKKVDRKKLIAEHEAHKLNQYGAPKGQPDYLRTILRDVSDPVYNYINKYLKSWHGTAQGSNAMDFKVMGEYIEHTLKTLGRDFEPADIAFRGGRLGNVNEEIFIRLRAMNQAYLEAVGYPEETLLYRGTDGGHGGEVVTEIKKAAWKGQTKHNLKDSSFAGYTKQLSTADGFGCNTDGYTVRAMVRREDIVLHRDLFSGFTHEYISEGEVIVKGIQKDFDIKDIKFKYKDKRGHYNVKDFGEQLNLSDLDKYL